MLIDNGEVKLLDVQHMNVSELKKLCTAQGIKGHTNKKKVELVEMLQMYFENQKVMKADLLVALENGEKMYKVYHGLAAHVDGCGIHMRDYHGKPFANILDDCLTCGYLLATSQNMGNYDFPEQFIICGAKRGFQNINLKTHDLIVPFDREEFLEKLKDTLLIGQQIFECANCEFIYADYDHKFCPTCGESVNGVTQSKTNNS